MSECSGDSSSFFFLRFCGWGEVAVGVFAVRSYLGKPIFVSGFENSAQRSPRAKPTRLNLPLQTADTKSIAGLRA